MKLDGISHGIRLAVAYLLYCLGFLHLLKAIRLRRKAVVLMYHRVLSSEWRKNASSHEGIIVDSEVFKKQIKYLSKCFRVVSLEEFAKRLEYGGRFEKYTCLITFDDGWRDNYTNAFPVLQAHRTPATIFLSINHVGQASGFWQERLSEMLMSIHDEMKRERRGLFPYSELLEKYQLQRIAQLGEDSPKRWVSEIVSAMKQYDHKYIEKMVAEISEAVPIRNKERDGCDAFLDWCEIEEMKQGGITFGSHGMNHRILTKIAVPEAESEITESRRIIQRKIGNMVSAISYPNGDYDSRILAITKESGYDLAFGTERGLVDIEDNAYRLRRVNVHNDMTWNVPMLLCRILGVF